MKTEELVEFLEELGFSTSLKKSSIVVFDDSGLDVVLERWEKLSKKEIIQFICSESYSAGWSEGLLSYCGGDHG